MIQASAAGPECEGAGLPGGEAVNLSELEAQYPLYCKAMRLLVGEKLRIALQQVTQAQEELGRRRHRLHGLEEVHGSLARAPEGVRTVMEWAKEGHVAGVLEIGRAHV